MISGPLSYRDFRETGPWEQLFSGSVYINPQVKGQNVMIIVSFHSGPANVSNCSSPDLYGYDFEALLGGSVCVFCK